MKNDRVMKKDRVMQNDKVMQNARVMGDEFEWGPSHLREGSVVIEVEYSDRPDDN